MRDTLILFKKGFGIAAANRMAYRGDFLISLFIMMLAEFFVPVVTVLIYHNGASYPGWSFEEILLIQGVFMVSRGVGSVLFFGMIDTTLSAVREGSFDLFLIKPRSVLVMTMVSGIGLPSMGRALTGTMVCAVAIHRLGMPNSHQWLWFFILFCLSLMVMFSFAVIMASTVIKWVGNGRVYEIFEALVTFGMYPKTVFSQAFANLLTYVIPIMLIGYLPASVLLGREALGMGYSFAGAVIFLGFALLLWKKMIGSYTSAGG